MSENEAQRRAREEERGNRGDTTADKGPTEKLRDQGKPEEDTLVPGTEVPGAQNPESKEIKGEINPNTE